MIETGIRYRRKKSLAQATFFSGAYKDRIRWLPIGDTWVYGPINIDQSTSMGVEVQYEHEQKLNWGEVFWNLNGGWTQATWVTDSTEYQLSYIPALSGGLVLGTRVRDFEFTYSHNYTSERFTTSDESQSLPAYQIGSVRASYKVFGKENSHSLNLSVEVNNVWGESYQIMPWRPMPGRELIFTLRYSI